MKKAIKELIQLNIRDRDELTKAKRRIAKKHKIGILGNAEILNHYRELVRKKAVEPKQNWEKILKKRPIRTLSGVAPVAVLTKPYPCPGRCVYCPAEKAVPKSYLSNEPAVMRAIRCNYNPYVQVQDRLSALVANGHEPHKIELIVIGGTWSVLPKKYKYWYIANCFAAANRFRARGKKSKHSQDKKYRIKAGISLDKLKQRLIEEQRKNEKAEYRIVGLTLETRPDYIDKEELWEMRELGCTRVEIGVQAIDDNILKINQRGHKVEEIVVATKLLKIFGFKVTYHIMLALPGSSPSKDFKMFRRIFEDERFQPDQIKFYPTVVTKGSLLYSWWRAGKYKPYPDKILRTLIAECKKIVPPYVRIIRLIRDIPSESIVAGNKTTNLRQLIKEQDGVECNCIRCREVKDRKASHIKKIKLDIIKYQASGGREYFLQYVSPDKKHLYGLCRLRLPEGGDAPEVKIFSQSAFIRELHVYGELIPHGRGAGKVQHIGLGKKLVKKAEEIAVTQGYKKMVIISGVGVRGYYRRHGYRLQNTYMVKALSK